MSGFFTQIVQRLANGKISSPRLEARLICAEVLQKEPDCISDFSDFTPSQKQQITLLLKKRLKHFPLDKILGHRYFYKYNFITGEDVLSPRPDTEILVEAAANILRNKQLNSILDLGTGSGCIIISLLLDFPWLSGTAVDISAPALAIAKQNALNLKVADRLKFIQYDWKSADFCAVLKQKFFLITANPPYIPSADIASLEPEVKNHDPISALDGGISGLDCYKELSAVANDLLENGGYIFLESGINQALKISDIFTATGLKLISIVPDLSGINRCVILQKPVAKIKKS